MNFELEQEARAVEWDLNTSEMINFGKPDAHFREDRRLSHRMVGNADLEVLSD